MIDEALAWRLVFKRGMAWRTLPFSSGTGRRDTIRGALRRDDHRAAVRSRVRWAPGALPTFAGRFPGAPFRTRRARFVVHRALRRCSREESTPRMTVEVAPAPKQRV